MLNPQLSQLTNPNSFGSHRHINLWLRKLGRSGAEKQSWKAGFASPREGRSRGHPASFPRSSRESERSSRTAKLLKQPLGFIPRPTAAYTRSSRVKLILLRFDYLNFHNHAETEHLRSCTLLLNLGL